MIQKSLYLTVLLAFGAPIAAQTVYVTNNDPCTVITVPICQITWQYGQVTDEQHIMATASVGHPVYYPGSIDQTGSGIAYNIHSAMTTDSTCTCTSSEVSVEYEDTSGSAGTRKGTASRMVLVANQGSSRVGTLRLLGCDEFETGYPKWSGHGISGADGSLYATYNGSWTLTEPSNQKVEIGPGDFKVLKVWTKSQGVGSNVPLHINLGASSNYVNEIKNKINVILGTVTGTTTSVTYSGEFDLVYKRVDKYNSVSQSGVYVNATGTAEWQLAAFSAEGPPFPVWAGVTVKPKASFNAAKLSYGANGTLDHSKASTGAYSFFGEAEQGISGGVVITAGAVCSIEILGGSTLKLKVSGPGSTPNENIKIRMEGDAGQFTATVRAYIDVGIECTLFQGQHTFGGSYELDETYTVYTFES